MGGAGGTHTAAKQRQIYFQGADPFEQLNNPFLRSRGALLVGEDFHYQAPGGAGVRGMDSRVSTGAIVALNLELERTLLARASAQTVQRCWASPTRRHSAISRTETTSIFSAMRASVFAPSIASATPGSSPDSISRLYVNRPELAQDREPGDDQFAVSLDLQLRAGVLRKREGRERREDGKEKD